jgi:PAS domain S-box-containing protein
MITFLLVDDELAILDTCRRILERSGQFAVDTASSGKEALEQIHAKTYDAIVSDYQMEDIDGLELLKTIRQEFPDLPFIIFSGKGREEVIIEAYEHGVDFYVQKGGDVQAQYAELAHKVTRAVESRRIKQKLARSEERFLNFVRNFEGVAFQVDSKGQFLILEGTVEEITGYPKEEFLSGYVSLITIIHPEDKSDFSESLQQLFTVPGIKSDSLFRIVRKDGHIRWLHAILHNICTKKQDIVHIQGVLSDITYLKSAEEELARTEKKWRTIITRAPVIISVVDQQGKFLFINKSRPPHKPADLIGTSAGDYLAPGQKTELEDALCRVHGTGETLRFESAIHLGENVMEWLAHQISPVSWDNNDAAALIVSTVITERKWLEQNLRDSEEQYRAIVTASGDGIVILDPNGTVTFGSPRVYDIFAIPCDQPLAGTYALDFIDPAERPVALQRMRSVLSGDIDADPFEYRLIRRDGSQFRGELVSTPLRDASGAITRLLVLIRDISSRR